MSKIFQERLNELLKEDYTAISKLYLLYELQAFSSDIDDDLLNTIYQAFLDNKNYNSIYDYVLEIQDWCEGYEIKFSEIKDCQIKTMIDEI